MKKIVEVKSWEIKSKKNKKNEFKLRIDQLKESNKKWKKFKYKIKKKERRFELEGSIINIR
jgi:hypothetical protein